MASPPFLLSIIQRPNCFFRPLSLLLGNGLRDSENADELAPALHPAPNPDSLDPTGPDTFTFSLVDAQYLHQSAKYWGPLQREPAPQLNLRNEKSHTCDPLSGHSHVPFRIQNLTLKSISLTQSHKLTLIGAVSILFLHGTLLSGTF